MTTTLPPVGNNRCRLCQGTGITCEAHLGLVWAASLPAETDVEGCACGAPGAPCPRCFPEHWLVPIAVTSEQAQAERSWRPTLDQFLLVVGQLGLDAVMDKIGITPTYLYGAVLAMLERIRQVVVEGFDADHDDDVGRHEKLARAAAVYAMPLPQRDFQVIEEFWPWEEPDFYKPTPHDRTKELTKAAGLLIAAIDFRVRNEPKMEEPADGQ